MPIQVTENISLEIQVFHSVVSHLAAGAMCRRLSSASTTAELSSVYDYSVMEMEEKSHHSNLTADQTPFQGKLPIITRLKIRRYILLLKDKWHYLQAEMSCDVMAAGLPMAFNGFLLALLTKCQSSWTSFELIEVLLTLTSEMWIYASPPDLS